MKEPDDITFYGAADLTSTGALTMPANARKELSMPAETKVLIFGSPRAKKAIIVASPEGAKLLAAVTDANRK